VLVFSVKTDVCIDCDLPKFLLRHSENLADRIANYYGFGFPARSGARSGFIRIPHFDCRPVRYA
jgi:hypothetical protein